MIKSTSLKRVLFCTLALPLVVWAWIITFDLDDKLDHAIGASRRYEWVVRLIFTVASVLVALAGIALVAFLITFIVKYIIRKPSLKSSATDGFKALIALLLIGALIALPLRQASAAPGGATSVSKQFEIAVLPGQQILFPKDFPQELVETMRWAILHAPDNTPIVVTSDEALKESPTEVHNYALTAGASTVYTPSVIRSFPTGSAATPDWILVAFIVFVLVLVVYVIGKAIANAMRNYRKMNDAYTNRMDIDVVASFDTPGTIHPRRESLMYPIIGTNVNMNANWYGEKTMMSRDLVHWTPLARFDTGPFTVLTNDSGQMVFITDVYATDMNGVVMTNRAMSSLLNPNSPIVMGAQPFTLPCPPSDHASFTLMSNPN